MNGAAGGPMIVSTPGPDGIMSPMRTSPVPLIVTDVEPPAPIGSGYGTPDTEFTIWHTLPTVASGRPPAVTAACVITLMKPESGGPAAPGLRTTAHPTVTGDPGMADGSGRAEARHPGDADGRPLDRRRTLTLERGGHPFDRDVLLGLHRHVPARFQADVAL